MSRARRWTPVADEAALVEEYRPLAVAIAGDYFIPGSDRDDVEQEALIGLLVAARDYDGSQPFGGFAWFVVHRWLQTRVTMALRDKHRPLTEAKRVVEIDDGELADALSTVVDHDADPLHRFEQRSELRAVLAALPSLTAGERHAVLGFANGLHYNELGANKKQVDNAIQRARRKLKAAA